MHDVFATPLLQQLAAAVLSLATLEVQRHNRDDEADEGSPCAKRKLCSGKSRDEEVLEHSMQLTADRPPRTHEQGTKQF